MIGFFERHRRVRGSISIFLSIMILPILSLGNFLVESSRCKSANELLHEADKTAAISMLAEYNTTLEKRFGLLAMADKKATEKNYEKYVKYNSNDIESKKISGLSVLYSINKVEFSTMYSLSNNYVLRRQILEYEKYRMAADAASDLLDIDKHLKNLKEQLMKEIPGIKMVLDMCDAIDNIYNFMSSMYTVEKDVSKLNVAITGDENVITKAQSALAELFGNDTITADDYNPNYNQAYRELTDAVNAKADYISKHSPAPSDPGAEPANGDGEKVKNLTKRTTQIEALIDLINELTGDKYYKADGTGINNENDMIQFQDTTIVNALNTLGIDNDRTVTYKSLFDMLAEKSNQLIVKDLVENDDSRYRCDTWVAVSKKCGEKDAEINVSINTEKANIDAYSEWQKKDKEYDDYQSEMKKLNDTVSEKLDNMKSITKTIYELLKTYSTDLASVSGKVSGAADALGNIYDVSDKANKTENEIDIFQKTISDEKFSINTANGMAKLQEQVNNLSKLNVIDINNSSQLNLKDGKEVNKYYLRYDQVLDYETAMAGITLFEKGSEIVDIYNSMKYLINLFNVLPNGSDSNKSVILNDSTYSILPSQSNLDNVSNDKDLENINRILRNASDEIGHAYGFDPESINPYIKTSDGQSFELLEDKIDEVIDCTNSIMDETEKMSSDMVFGVGLFTLVFRLHSICKDAKIIINDMKILISNLKDTLSALMYSLYDGMAISTYATSKFPNRTDDMNDKYYLDYTKSVNNNCQTFSGACQEYILVGDRSETVNQQKTFKRILMLRIICNAVSIITNKDAIEILSKCNIFALIVYPLWVYYESNIDMNFMLLGNNDVPLYKTTLILSISNLKSMLSSIGVDVSSKSLKFDSDGPDEKSVQVDVDLEKLDDSTKRTTARKFVEKFFKPGDGFCKMGYKDYIWFMLMTTSNTKKLNRIGDLVQMEMRYSEMYKSKEKPTFMMTKANTYIRGKTTGAYNSILPVISYSKNNNGRVIGDIFYQGY